MRFKAVALDMMGVVYPIGDDLRDLIIPFLKSEGCDRSDQDFIDAYRRCYRGGADAASFWESLGYTPPFDEIETLLLHEYQLTFGAVEFLEALQAAGIPTFSLTNDVAGWAAKRRRLLGIDAYFSGAVVSGEAGIVKPEPAIYQALAQLLPCPPRECLFVDDRATNVDGAIGEGFAAVLFGAAKNETHDAVEDFAALAAYLGLTDSGVPSLRLP
jgi:HAD superfamily hydrolase (TIGR01509 family)